MIDVRPPRRDNPVASQGRGETLLVRRSSQIPRPYSEFAFDDRLQSPDEMEVNAGPPTASCLQAALKQPYNWKHPGPQGLAFRG